VATFNSQSFGERIGEGSTFPAFSREAVVSVRHVPGGNTNVIQSAGLGPDRVSLGAYCSSAELSALLNQVGSSSTLVYSFGTFSNVLLESITSVAEVRSSGRYFATLNFIKR
jgi:hypothetical protein